MRKVSRIASTILILIMLWTMSEGTVSADVWEFGSEGPGKNPFTPRGYLVDTESGQHWLSSPYDNNGFYVRYTGATNGVYYLEHKKSDGTDYTFYAMTDRNPWTDKTDRIGYGGKYFFAYKNGRRISNFNDYIQTPATRGDKVDPSGQGTCWVFRIEGFSLEPGCKYEFGFLRGMQANNGITLVLSLDENGNPNGYIQETDAGLSAAERSRYNSEKYKEFEFISSWYKNEDGSGYTVNTVPMRFSIQTYADISVWEAASENAQSFLDSVTEQDLKTGKYARNNITDLKAMLLQLNDKAKNEVRLMLQTTADAQIRYMVTELNEMLDKAKTEKPEPADMKKLQETIAQAEELYAKASANTGIDVGQYGQIEVGLLKDEINRAKQLDRFYPQSEIYAQVKALEDAMREVRASKVLEEQMVFYDKVTGIYVIAPVDSFPEDATMVVRVMGPETEEYKAAAGNLSDAEVEAVYYKMDFFKGDKRIQPSKQITVQIPVDIDISQATSTVYAADEAGTLTKMNSVNANGTHIFKADKVNAFVMAGSTATEEEKAAQRGEHMQEIMNQKDDEQADNKETKLAKKKQKKEDAKDPLDSILKRNANKATFSNDVRRETDPVYVIYIAIALAAAAVVLGIKGFMGSGKNKKGK